MIHLWPLCEHLAEPAAILLLTMTHLSSLNSIQEQVLSVTKVKLLANNKSIYIYLLEVILRIPLMPDLSLL